MRETTRVKTNMTSQNYTFVFLEERAFKQIYVSFSTASDYVASRASFEWLKFCVTDEYNMLSMQHARNSSCVPRFCLLKTKMSACQAALHDLPYL